MLESINPTLTDVVEYGVITFFAKPLFLLLDKLYDFCGNWGWAIILLTLIVRIVLYPLTYKGMVSMQKLKDLAPKMKELQEAYPSYFLNTTEFLQAIDIMMENSEKINMVSQ